MTGGPVTEDERVDSAQARGSTSLLDVVGIEVIYEKVEVAIRGVSVSAPEDRITVVLGANGAGKTSLLRAICGFLPGERAAVTQGQIIFDGERIDGWRPHKVSRRGLALVPERDKIFPTLTVEENLRVSVVAGRRARGKEIEALVYDTFPQLASRRKSAAGYLSGGERQMLAVGCALLCEPRLLLIDELSLGLAPNLVEELFELVRRIAREQRLAVLLVEQNAGAALKIADYTYVIEGRVVLAGTAAEMRDHDEIRELYLGISQASAEVQSFARVKQYARRRRWF